MLDEAPRGSLREILDAHLTMGPDEAQHLASMCAFAEAVEDPYDRDEPVGHFTASALVVSPGLDRVLMLHHRRLGRWLQCGGHIEPDDASPYHAALREAHEETGLERLEPHPLWNGLLDVDVHTIPADHESPAHDHHDLRYLLVADPEAPLARAESETKDLRWFTLDEAEALVSDPGLHRLFQKVRGIRSLLVAPISRAR